MSARSVGRLTSVGLVLVLALWLLSGCAGGEEQKAEGEKHNIYFGWLLTDTTDMAAVAFDVGAPDAEGAREVRAYVCDGLGPPDGMAVWFWDSVNEKAAKQVGEMVSFTSPGGQEMLQIGYLDDREVRGAFTNANGRTSRFIAYPAFAGGGIYEVTLDEDLVYSGTSTDGSSLEGKSSKDGNVEGTITTAGGEKIDFFTQTMALASAEALTEQGLPTTYRQFAANAQVPGEYVAVVAPGGTHWFGRSGNVRGGSPGANIIGLDKSH
jgi:hypothetical protein